MDISNVFDTNKNKRLSKPLIEIKINSKQLNELKTDGFIIVGQYKMKVI